MHTYPAGQSPPIETSSISGGIGGRSASAMQGPAIGTWTILVRVR